jgi:hypothetical protein
MRTLNCVWVLGLFEVATFFFRRSLLLHGVHGCPLSFCLCVVWYVGRWRLAFMEDEGAGLMKVASNDGGLGEWDGTALEEWRSFWKTRTKF